MKQKIIKIGNSTGIIIPQKAREATGIKLGDSVMVGTYGNSLKITPLKKKTEEGEVDAKFMKMVDEFLTEHEDVLKELANR